MHLPRWVSQVTLVVKNPPASTGDVRDVCSIPGSGRSHVACEERTVRFGGSDLWAGRAAGQGWGRSLERHSPGTQSRARGLGGGLPGQALGLFWPATHGALPLGSTPGPQGGRGCPWEVRQPWERGHGKKGISRNQRFI